VIIEICFRKLHSHCESVDTLWLGHMLSKPGRVLGTDFLFKISCRFFLNTALNSAHSLVLQNVDRNFFGCCNT